MINIVVSSRYRLNRKKLKTFAQQILTEKGIGPSFVVNIVFVGKTKMRSITQTYKHEKETLPVLSFPYQKAESDGERILGEVFICYPYMVLLAAERNKKVEQITEFLVKHGIENLIQ